MLKKEKNKTKIFCRTYSTVYVHGKYYCSAVLASSSQILASSSYCTVGYGSRLLTVDLGVEGNCELTHSFQKSAALACTSRGAYLPVID